MAEVPSIRSATPADYAAFARLFPELGVEDPIPAENRWRDEIMPSTWVAERAGRVVGYCFTQLLRDIGRVRHLVVARDVWRSGIGRALMQAVAEHFRAHGASEWCLNVKPDNAPAIRLYESLGLRSASRSCALRMNWSFVSLLPPDEAGVVAKAAEREDDGGLELAFNLPDGLLADARGRLGRVLLKLVQPSGVPVGVAAFDPASRLTHPFRVARPRLAGTLLRALRGYAETLQGSVQVMVEEDMELVQSLISAGATMRLDVLNFRGNL
jgi:GNAT superfamily N-acetyltransferase